MERPSISSSQSDDEGSHPDCSTAADRAKDPTRSTAPGVGGRLEPAVLVYHESARSIVFRDHLRRVVIADDNNKASTSSATVEKSSSYDHQSDQEPPKTILVTKPSGEVDGLGTLGQFVATELFDSHDTVLPSEAGIDPNQIGNYQPNVVPLPPKEFGPDDIYEDLVNSPVVLASGNDHDGSWPDDWREAEIEVVRSLNTQQCTVKTIKNNDWSSFIHRFQYANPPRKNSMVQHDDIPPDDQHTINSFVTSVSLLPRGGTKMRCYGSPNQYTVGVIFALPFESDQNNGESEDEAQTRTDTWSWPSGYSAKTEFNIDGRGQLINGRREALVSFSTLRQYNEDYLTKDSYMIGLRMVSGLNQIPYNEVFLRVGGVGRLVNGHDVSTGERKQRSFDRGVGLPIGLFVRCATYGHLITLLRTRARLMHVLGENHFKGIPLLYISPESGIRVLTDKLLRNLWKFAAQCLNPFQNNSIAYKTTVDHTDDLAFQQKVEELLDLNDETIRTTLTPEELGRLAGGFGATDDSVAGVLDQALMYDREINNNNTSGGESVAWQSHRLQDVVNEGLAHAIRSGDYHTSRQLLILYSLVAARRSEHGVEDGDSPSRGLLEQSAGTTVQASHSHHEGSVLGKGNFSLVTANTPTASTLSLNNLPPLPPPPPLDTDRLRSATNSDGLLAVLGAAQVLRAMQDGSAQRRVKECVDAVEEWVDYGEQSVAFRISSWYDQRAAQEDLKINTENDSQFLAFISNKAIKNRRTFAQQLREAIAVTDFSGIRFLQAVDQILKGMNSPCLRLELLQYVLGLDNRYSVAHVRRSVELAATCLNISAASVVQQQMNNNHTIESQPISGV